MGCVPVPGEMYFSDFAFDVVECHVERFGKDLGTVKTLSNSENGVEYLHVMYSSDVQIGDILRSETGSRVRIKEVEVERYEGKPTMLKLFI